MNTEYSHIQICVISGGFSAERAVALRGGKNVEKALTAAGCQVIGYDLNAREFELPPADVYFLVLHGPGGEDGWIQGILESKNMIYTGSDSHSSRIALDKITAKEVFRTAGIPVAKDWVLRRSDGVEKGDILKKISIPCVVKPSLEGSSIGIQLVRAKEELPGALEEAFKIGETLLIEEYLDGREFTVGVLGNQPLPVVEIRPKQGWFDYHNKYTEGATEEMVPAPIETELKVSLQNAALKAHQALGCRDLSRSDFRMNSKGEWFILETNTLPGMTEVSLLPRAAAAAGISFPKLCLELVQAALNRRGRRL